MKIYVVYDSEGEHTKVLAEAIAEGARENDAAEVFIDHVDQADIRKLKDMDAIIWDAQGISEQSAPVLKLGSTDLATCGLKAS